MLRLIDSQDLLLWISIGCCIGCVVWSCLHLVDFYHELHLEWNTVEPDKRWEAEARRRRGSEDRRRQEAESRRQQEAEHKRLLDAQVTPHVRFETRRSLPRPAPRDIFENQQPHRQSHSHRERSLRQNYPDTVERQRNSGSRISIVSTIRPTREVSFVSVARSSQATLIVPTPRPQSLPAREDEGKKEEVMAKEKEEEEEEAKANEEDEEEENRPGDAICPFSGLDMNL